jgi:hypothetical protein
MTRLLALLFAVLPLAHAAGGDNSASPTLCLTYHVYLNGQPFPMPKGFDRMTTEKFSRIGYRPAPCTTAQIQLSMAMRITGETRENTRIRTSINGKNGHRTGHYEADISGQQYDEDPSAWVQSTALGFGSVMVQIDPDYPAKAMDALAEAVAAEQKNAEGQKASGGSYGARMK